MRIAIVAAGFTPAESDRLRRAMASFRHAGTVHGFRDKFVEGAVANGYARDFAERCFRQIEGFGDYGFPESHAASFALLVYASAWLKCFHPEIFACALLNSQPLGFYAPAQIVRDAREHGVEVRAVDINESAWDCTLEPIARTGRFALRLGFREVKGLAAEAGQKLVAARGTRRFADPAALAHRTGLARAVLVRLTEADAFRSQGLDRREALWAVQGLRMDAELPLFAPLLGTGVAEPETVLPAMSEGEQVMEDYRAVGLTLKRHPMALLRPALSLRGIVPTARLAVATPGRLLTVAGLVLVRQRPGTASGVVFVTLEDETGIANLVIWRNVFERFRRIVMGSRLLECRGRIEREGEVIHLVASHLTDLTPYFHRLREGATLAQASRDFH